MRKKTNEEFLAEVKKVHNDKYTPLENYTNGSTKIKIRCNTCNNVFSMMPSVLLSGSGCPQCAKVKMSLSKKKTNEQFLLDLYAVHGDTYIPQEAYTGNHNKLKVLCTNCGNIISIRPMVLLKKGGCPICAHRKTKEKLAYSNEQFLEKLKSVHSDKYTPIDEYVNYSTKIKIHCNDCGYEWSVTPANLLTGHGCPQCAIKNSKAISKISSNEDFIKCLKKQHKDSYIPLDEYVDENTAIKFHCNVCNSDFSATPTEILAPGIFCQTCKENQEALKQKFTEDSIFNEEEPHNYTAYYIENIINQKPIYVGITNDLDVRFRHHFTSINDPLYKDFHDQDWKNMFRIVAIKENITRSHALDIETKFINDFLAQGYPLYNVIKTNSQKQVNSNKYTRGSAIKVKCVETNEIFPSISEAMRQYSIDYKRLINACTYGDSAGINNDLQPLHWCYEPFKEYVPRSTKTYSIYAIEELIDNMWNPFYVGVTQQTLKTRLINHHTYNSKHPTFNPKLYDKLCGKGEEHFRNNIRIRAIQEGIVNREYAFAKEAQTIVAYNEKYKLVNLNIPYDNRMLQNPEQLLDESKKILTVNKQDKNTKYMSLPIINITSGDRFNTLTEAAKHLNISAGFISSVCNGTRNSAYKQKFAFLDEDFRILNDYKWFIILIMKNNIPYHITYEQAASADIVLNNLLSWYKYQFLKNVSDITLSIIETCTDKNDLYDKMKKQLKQLRKEKLTNSRKQLLRMLDKIQYL